VPSGVAASSVQSNRGYVAGIASKKPAKRARKITGSQIRTMKRGPSKRNVLALAGPISVERMRQEDSHAHQRQDQCRGLDHGCTSCCAKEARYLLHDCSQIRSNMNCMLAIPVFVFIWERR
jgi:hypothetical protein